MSYPRILSICAFAAFALPFSPSPRAFAAEEKSAPGGRTSPSGYIKYWPGDLPIVISAPHGGTKKPGDIPDRSSGVTVLDGYSAALATAIRDAMRQRFGRAPHLVICELARTKVDCNRDIAEGSQGNKKSEQVWHEYHNFIDEAEKAALAKNPHGMYFDIHSHGHEKKRVEIGYLLKKEDLAMSDEQLNADPKIAARTSIRSLDQLSPASFSDLVRGPTSLGGLLESHGIPAVPSPTAILEKDDPYFNGAYDVLAHGSRDKNQLDGAQLETPMQIRNTPETRAATGKALAESVDVYFEKHFGMKLPHANGTKAAP
ncbi:MAG TPA: hypothetical protein VGH65_10530 [Verrucomicrobiaceae bacterium]